jgi:hypothetical protein
VKALTLCVHGLPAIAAHVSVLQQLAMSNGVSACTSCLLLLDSDALHFAMSTANNDVFDLYSRRN